MNHTFKNHNEWAFWNLHFCWTVKTFCLPNGQFPYEIRCNPTKLSNDPKSFSMYSFYLTLWATNSSNPDFSAPSVRSLSWSPQAQGNIFSSVSMGLIYIPSPRAHHIKQLPIIPQPYSAIVLAALLCLPPSTHLENSYSFRKAQLNFSFSLNFPFSHISHLVFEHFVFISIPVLTVVL